MMLIRIRTLKLQARSELSRWICRVCTRLGKLRDSNGSHRAHLSPSSPRRWLSKKTSTLQTRQRSRSIHSSSKHLESRTSHSRNSQVNHKIRSHSKWLAVISRRRQLGHLHLKRSWRINRTSILSRSTFPEEFNQTLIENQYY